MKRYILFCFVCLFTSALSAQTLPSLQLNTLKGETINTRSLLNDSIPLVVTFWSTVCKPCIQELDIFSEQFSDWQKQVSFKIIAVSTDDARSTAKVAAFAAVNSWPFTILLDKNQDLKRALNVNNIPHLYVIDKKGNVVYSRIGYTPGSEEKVLEILKSL